MLIKSRTAAPPFSFCVSVVVVVGGVGGRGYPPPPPSSSPCPLRRRRTSMAVRGLVLLPPASTSLSVRMGGREGGREEG